MFKNNKIVAFIPARGGSKGLPRKNVLNLNGTPLIGWTIKQALRSEYVDRVIVSTEDDEIAEISKKLGADVPFKRPKILASDKALGMDVVIHALNWLDKKKQAADIIVQLLATSPLRLSSDIDKAIEFFFEKKADSVISVCEAMEKPNWTNVLPEDRCMKNFLRDQSKTNRQDFPKYYRLNGSMYLFKKDQVLKTKTFYGKKSFAYVMPAERSIDIDTRLDYKIAGYLLKERDKKEG